MKVFLLLVGYNCLQVINSSLISKSILANCGGNNDDPITKGEPCKKKFLVAMALKSDQVRHQ